MKVIVYSVNIGGYDDLWTPDVFDENVRYILFTDNKYFKSDVWEVNHIDFLSNENLDNRGKSRYIKTNPHKILPKHDISIWVDNCFKFKFNNVQDMLDDIGFMDKQIMCYKHEVRNCLYEESKIIKKMGLDIPSIVDEQMLKYRNENFPENYGLYQSGFMFRKNNSKVVKFNDIWWDEIKNFSGRDQLSQVYSSWKTGVEITPITGHGNVYQNKFLHKKIKHNKKWTR